MLIRRRHVRIEIEQKTVRIEGAFTTVEGETPSPDPTTALAEEILHRLFEAEPCPLPVYPIPSKD